MDNDDQYRLADWEDLALSHAGEKLRSPLQSALLFDRRISRIVLTASEPALGQLKLAWWREELAKAHSEPNRSLPDPLLAALSETWRAGVQPLHLLIDGWESQLPGEEEEDASEGLATARAAVFSHLAKQCGYEQASFAAARHGRVWAFAELAQLSGGSDGQALERGLEEARGLSQLPRELRSLAVIGGLSRRSLRRGGKPMFGDRWSPFAAIRLGIFGS